MFALQSVHTPHQYFHDRNMYKTCLQKSIREMSPKISGTEMYSHGFLEISGANFIIVSWIFGDI